MKSIAEKIAEGIDKFYTAFQSTRVRRTLEEISATTNEDDVAGAMAVAELNDNLGGCSFETREDGAYVKYTLPGGADPVLKKLGDVNKKFRITGKLNIYITADHDVKTGTISFIHTGAAISNASLPEVEVYSFTNGAGARAYLSNVSITEIN